MNATLEDKEQQIVFVLSENEKLNNTSKTIKTESSV